MDKITKIVQAHYDANVMKEWNRIAGRPEFLLTCRYLERYIKPGDTVLDIGGGPGRYSIHLAKMGCRVTLADLSRENVRFARAKAEEEGVSLEAVQCDVRTIGQKIQETYDHVLLMGPLYHLQKEEDRLLAIQSALDLLKTGGILYTSFISVTAGILYAMKEMPEIIIAESEKEYMNAFFEGKDYAGTGFTETFMIQPEHVEPLMNHFSLEKLHLFGQESIVASGEHNIMQQEEVVTNAWLDLSEKVCERLEFLHNTEHLMYIARKK